MTASLNSAEIDPLDLLVDSFVTRWRNGERPSLSEYAKDHPGLADRVRALLPAVVELEAAGSVAGPTPAALPDDEPAPRQLGEFRILRRVGKGGMGVVYEAVQGSLGRHVALKVLPPERAVEGSYLERFHREARLAARLHHTNIVPVFGTGEADGLHYYAMQFICGQALDGVLKDVRNLRQPATPADAAPAAASTASLAQDLATGDFNAPTRPLDAPATAPASSPNAAASGLTGQPEARYFGAVARLGMQAAEALQYAHSQGILHRDIKPSNLMLDAHGTLWITDFGLAKAKDDDDLTGGGVLGTLCYMAPERFHGPGDARSDIYSLGVTLYELLTLRQAFQGLETAPPRLRRIDPRIPRDLETIVSRAIAPDPADRYATAAALADDLRHFLEDRPLPSRRTPWRERAWRWCRRNPVVASLLGVVALLLIVIAVGGGIQNLFLNAALLRSETDRASALAAERERRQQLYEALVSRANVQRFSKRPGQRYQTLETLRQASALARPAADSDELRHLAVAALALPDFRLLKEWDGWPEGSAELAFEPVALRSYARSDREGNLTVRRLKDDVEIDRLPGLGKKRTFTFGPDDRTLYLHDQADGFLKRWRLGEREPVSLARTSTSRVARWNLSADGSRLMLLRREKDSTFIEIFAVPEGRRCFDVRLPQKDSSKNSESVALSPDGRWLAATQGELNNPQRNGVLIFDVTTGKQVKTLPSSANVHEPVWHPDSSVLAVAEWNTSAVHLWDVPSARRFHTFAELRTPSPQLGMSPSGELLAGHSNVGGDQRFWHPHSKTLLLRNPTPVKLPFSTHDGRQYGTVTEGTTLRLYAAEPSPVFRTLVCSPANPSRSVCQQVAVHRDGRLLAVGTDQGVLLFDLLTDRQVGRVALGNTRFVRFDPATGDLLTSGLDGLVRWPMQVDSRAPTEMVFGPPRLLWEPRLPASHEFGISRDGKLTIVAEPGRAMILRSGADKAADRLSPLDRERSVTLSPDGRWAVTHRDTTPPVNLWKVWDTRTGKVAFEAKAPATHFSPDGRWLTNGRQRWEVETWKEGSPLEQPDGPRAAAFSPDGRCFFSFPRPDGACLLVDSATGRTLATLELPESCRIADAVFTPDGTQLILSSVDHNLIYVWDLRALRRHLAEVGLDWDAPPYPPDTTPPGRFATPALPVQLKGVTEFTTEHAKFLHDQARRLATVPTPAANVQQALQFMGVVDRRDPKNPAYLSTLGIAQYRNLKYPEARATLQQSLDAGQERSKGTDLFFLAMCHAKLGDTVQAKKRYNEAVAWQKSQANLGRAAREELNRLQSEAAEVLGIAGG